MAGIMEYLYQYYYVVLILQGICLYHSFKRGTHQKWIWLIVFLPFIGSIIYIFTEIIKKNQIRDFKGFFINLINPTGRINELEKKLRFSETFQSKVSLAYAYQAANRNIEAIPLFESALSGIHSDDVDVTISLLEAYYAIENYKKVVELGNKLQNDGFFQKSEANIYYAFSLEKIEKFQEAEQVYQKLNRKLCNFQARYYYGKYLQRISQEEKARMLFEKMVEESHFLVKGELRKEKFWISKASEELKKKKSEL
ncbi:hypothetical protein EGI22_01805 [Lacihabitans sp. LS3-19]|uniref:hypothetical protein n=1 Tax=Lacihabitans sp. LS3-19 TaxID=2487335 RepID=UPI0020CCB6CB|nr:hypothetical protein [Lacihabitans sp. LS3-19]MCP9766624.1 hypothetical protein [Lacihabitans sp. LS3-19]